MSLSQRQKISILIDIMKPYFQNQNFILYHADFLTCTAIPNKSVDLIVTSPPYNVEIAYNNFDDNHEYSQYLIWTRKWLQKCLDLLKDDGRACINVALDTHKNGHHPLYADIIRVACEIGWQYQTTIIWHKTSISRRTAWGSFKSASAPNVIASPETIIVLYKTNWKKISGSRQNDITKEEFIKWTDGLWSFNAESKTRIGHPAPFPLELPLRCIKLFSYVGDTILDPFCGSGTTPIAAALNNRLGIGIDIAQNYLDIALKRMQHHLKGASK